MPNQWKWFVALGLAICWVVGAAPGRAGVPDITKSFYVPQAGSYSTPTENASPPPGFALAPAVAPAASRFFRMCVNNDGGASLPNNARIKVQVLDANGNPVAGIPAADVCLLFNGGTPAQGFSGVGADSVIANAATNPTCPDVRCVQADGPTNAAGLTWITFAGAPAVFGVAPSVRDPGRKWGHFDNEIPVYVLGFKISGAWNSGSTIGTYSLRIKNMDWTGGLGLGVPGESVDFNDFSGVAAGAKGIANPFNYWKDFDFSGAVDFNDISSISNHIKPAFHTCTFPLNP